MHFEEVLPGKPWPASCAWQFCMGPPRRPVTCVSAPNTAACHTVCILITKGRTSQFPPDKPMCHQDLLEVQASGARQLDAQDASLVLKIVRGQSVSAASPSNLNHSYTESVDDVQRLEKRCEAALHVYPKVSRPFPKYQPERHRLLRQTCMSFLKWTCLFDAVYMIICGRRIFARK
jgi:hypothetical protein